MSPRGSGGRRLAKPLQAKPHLLLGAVLVAWACAKGAAPDQGPGYVTPSSGGTTSATGGTTGGTAQLGGTGGTVGAGATGGSLPASGGTGATSGTGGTVPAAGGTSAGGSGGTGGSTGGVGGTLGSGGTTPAGGTAGSGSSAGGMPGVAGGGSGGMPGGGMTNSGGSGGGLPPLPNDPNFKPPDMSNAKLIVLYTNQQMSAMSYNIGMMLQLKNQTDTPYDLSKVTIRYWFTSEAAPMPALNYSAPGLSAVKPPKFVGNMGVSYLEMSFSKGGIVPVYVDMNSLNDTNMSVNVQAGSNTGEFNQANDWSYATGTGYKENPKITVYDNGVLIWGCDPWETCADTTDMGAAGAGN